MFNKLMVTGALALSLSAFALAPAQAERGEGFHGGGGGAVHGGGGAAFHGGGGSLRGGAVGGFHGGAGAFRGATSTFHAGAGTFHGGATAFNGGLATANAGGSVFHGPFRGTVHAFNGGIHPGIRAPFRGAWVGPRHHHRYAWWDDEPYYGPCHWRHEWIWNGYREVRELVRVWYLSLKKTRKHNGVRGPVRRAAPPRFSVAGVRNLAPAKP